MKPTELRLGNWIIDPEGKEVQVDEIGGYENPLSLFMGMYKPIPLTEEWLKKFGWSNFSASLWAKDLIWDSNFDNGILEFSIIEVSVKYVHQLQNLYFALIGKELEIK